MRWKADNSTVDEASVTEIQKDSAVENTIYFYLLYNMPKVTIAILLYTSLFLHNLCVS